MNDLDLYYTNRLHLEQALAGAALLDDAAADLLLAELNPRDFLCSLSQAVLAALKSVRDEQPVRYATEPTLDLVLEELGLTGSLQELEELGGRQAVLELVQDRPELRQTQAALQAAVDAMAPLAEEPVVLFAAKELGATPSTNMTSTNIRALSSSASVTEHPEPAVTRSRNSTASPSPVTRSRHLAASQRSRQTGRPGGAP